MYSVEQINHVIYHNRTFEGVTQNFLPRVKNLDILMLLELEKQISFVNKIVVGEKYIKIDKSKLDLDGRDIQLLPEELYSIKVSSRNFSEEEKQLLERKKIPEHIIEQYDISPLSQFKDNREILEKLGVTTHPIFIPLLGDEITEGLIIPLYRDGRLINASIRKTTDLTKLKYGITVPSLDLWGDTEWENQELCITEGVFDMMAIREQGLKCVSSSSCSLNDIQYLKIIKGRPKIIKIFADNDSSGYSSAFKAKKIFGLNGIPVIIYASTQTKDMSEHFFELKLGWDEIKEINITTKMIRNSKDNTFDFLQYLENRKF